MNRHITDAYITQSWLHATMQLPSTKASTDLQGASGVSGSTEVSGGCDQRHTAGASEV
jgi:hypothetical protein